MKHYVLIVFLCSSFSLFAQEPLTLEKALSFVATQNPSVIIQRFSLELAKRSRNEAWSRLYPVVNANAGVQWQRSDASNAPSVPGIGASGVSEDMSASLGVNASLTLAPALFSQINSAYIRYKSQEISFDDFQVQLELQVRKFYFDLLLLKDVLDLLQKQFDRAQEQLENSEQAFASGFSSELELLQVRLRADSLRLELERQQSVYDRTRSAFLVLLGLDGDTALSISGTLADFNLSASFLDSVAASRDVSIFSRTDIRLTQQEMQLNKSSRNARRLQLLPAITISYLYNGTFNDLDADNYYSDLQRLQASLVWNLSEFFPFSASWTGLANAKTNAALLDETLSSQVREANLSVDRLLGEVERSLTTTEERTLNVALADELYTLTQESYENGNVNYDVLRQAELDRLTQQQSLLRERVNLIKNAFDLAYQVGIDFDSVYTKE